MTTDPLADVRVGDDEDNVYATGDAECESAINTAFLWNTDRCVRDAHPGDWQHLSACDGEVDAAWFDLPGLPHWVLLATDDSFEPKLVCRSCGMGHEPRDGSTGHEMSCTEPRSLLTDLRALAAKAGETL